jgi:hypothetical protein
MSLMQTLTNIHNLATGFAAQTSEAVSEINAERDRRLAQEKAAHESMMEDETARHELRMQEINHLYDLMIDHVEKAGSGHKQIAIAIDDGE